jgi:hypothetical protein
MNIIQVIGKTRIIRVGIQGPPGASAALPVPITGPATVTVTPGTLYLCDVTAGSIVLNVPILQPNQSFAVKAAAGGSAYATNSITVVSTPPQNLERPEPNNLMPATTFIAGGPTPSSGLPGTTDAGGLWAWSNAGVTNTLTLIDGGMLLGLPSTPANTPGNTQTIRIFPGTVSTASGATVPAGATILSVSGYVTTTYSLGPSWLEVGVSGTPTLLVPSGFIDLTQPTGTTFTIGPLGSAWLSFPNTSPILATPTGSPSVGACGLVLTYAVPLS